VVDRAWHQALRPPRARSDPLQVSVPEPEGQIHEPPPSAWRTFGHVDCLEHQVAEEEAKIESGVAPVGAFEIEQDQAFGVHQDILGTEVAQNKRTLVRRHIHCGDERLDPLRR